MTFRVKTIKVVFDVTFTSGTWLSCNRLVSPNEFSELDTGVVMKSDDLSYPLVVFSLGEVADSKFGLKKMVKDVPKIMFFIRSV